MEASSRPANLLFRNRTEEWLRRRFALTVRGLTKDWRSYLGDCLAMLPLELLSMILDELFCPFHNTDHDEERKDIKLGLSRTSLVCREWCRIQRPKLFKSIWAGSTAEVQFLLNMLRRPGNDWLSAAITDLIEADGLDEQIISPDRFCRLLLPKLPALAVFKYDGDSPDPSARQFRPSLQPVFARHGNIRELSLASLQFYSMSALVHVLGDMVNLEELDLYQCRFSNSDNRPTTRTSLSSFPKLRRVAHQTSYQPQTGRLGWLFSPLLARRCRDHPEDATSSNSDAALLVLLGNLFRNGTNEVSEERYNWDRRI